MMKGKKECWTLLSILLITSSPKPVSAVNPLQYLDADTSGKGTDISTGCNFSCSNSPKQYFCASNGRTLDSECKVREAQCNDRYLNVTVGRCQSSERCLKERNHNLWVQNLLDPSRAVNVPSCKNDGTYAPVQCHMYFNSCWCVTPLGKVIKKSTFVIGNSSSTCAQSGGRKRRCSSDADKAAFAFSLRNLIDAEARRRSPSGSLRQNVLRKHRDIDRNRDGNLNAKEMRKLLKKYRRRLSRPCMKVFWKFCDYNDNKLISLTEWGFCLGVLPNMRALNAHTPQTPLIVDSPPWTGNKNISRPNNSRPATSPYPPETCRYERQELLKTGKKNVNIPDCEGPGDRNWSPMQCLGSYCYCVIPETGTPVPDTAMLSSKGKPNCVQVMASLDVPHPIPGCPAHIKPKFLRAIHYLLKDEMDRNLIIRGSNIGGASLKERAAKNFFRYMDKNGDGVLNHKESKAFKKRISKAKVSKKCLRKFTQHCDRNKDSKITVDEYIGCLEVRLIQKINPLPYNDVQLTINTLKTTEDSDNSLG